MNTKKLGSAFKTVVADLVKLRKPTIAASVVALFVQLLPGVHLNVVEFAGILVGVGTVAALVQELVSNANKK